MTIAFLNDRYLPLDEARISPMDRGFLFGDGIYEVIPTHAGQSVGLHAHLARMAEGLAALQIANPFSTDQWQQLVDKLAQQNAQALDTPYIGVYLHVTRGTHASRQHAYPASGSPTVFAYGFAMATPPVPLADKVTGLHVALTYDLRWQRCNIKSTSLLGNVMHYQHGAARQKQETILLNRDDEVTEAASCNVFAVIDGQIITPPLDHQLLPGITRQLVIDSLAREGLEVQQAPISKEALLRAQEVWLTSSSKEIAPVLSIEDQPVGQGHPGPVWQQAIEIFNRHKYSL